MTAAVEVDRATGTLLVAGRKLFPLVLSDGPPLGAKAPTGDDALAELAAGGANFIRTGRSVWSAESIEQQIAAERELLDAAAANDLHCWLQLGNVPDLSSRGHVRNCRVGIHEGLPIGACFAKYGSP